ncbi:MAG: hypothetical protein DSZ29_02215 [Aquificaceae bacterium]|nr:MAG: hypothetical protein DSZ29_02215 [Aquificaceae bacterium]
MLNAVNWEKFERAGLGSYKSSALSWMLHHAKIAWELLFRASVITILKQHGITKGTLVLDESDRARSKRTRFIHKAHKQKDKATGGYVNGQTIVLLLLVTETITFPVGFAFYMPDPVVSAWRKEDVCDFNIMLCILKLHTKLIYFIPKCLPSISRLD